MKISIGKLELTQFVPSDTRELYLVRNHPSVRKGMSNPELIPYQAHREWVQKNLIDKQELLLFMVRKRGLSKAIGLTQLRIQGDTGEIGVMFREPWKHHLPATFSTVATLHLAFCHLNLLWINSYVIPEHQDAIRFNQAWGVIEVETDRPGLIKLRLAANTCLNNPAYLKIFPRINSRLQIST